MNQEEETGDADVSIIRKQISSSVQRAMTSFSMSLHRRPRYKTSSCCWLDVYCTHARLRVRHQDKTWHKMCVGRHAIHCSSLFISRQRQRRTSSSKKFSIILGAECVSYKVEKPKHDSSGSRDARCKKPSAVTTTGARKRTIRRWLQTIIYSNLDRWLPGGFDVGKVRL